MTEPTSFHKQPIRRHVGGEDSTPVVTSVVLIEIDVEHGHVEKASVSSTKWLISNPVLAYLHDRLRTCSIGHDDHRLGRALAGLIVHRDALVGPCAALVEHQPIWIAGAQVASSGSQGEEWSSQGAITGGVVADWVDG